jgi:hypothetical protein
VPTASTQSAAFASSFAAADAAHVQRIIPRERALARLRLRDRDAVPPGERAQRIGGFAVQHAATRHDQRLARFAQRGGRFLDLARDRRGRMKPHDARLEERGGVVPGHRLHVLRQRERDRAAERRVGQHAQRARQRAQQLRGMHDAVEIAGDRPQCVVRGDAAVVQVLHLLQHRIGRARHEDVARQEQHGQAVHVRERRGGDEVRRARPDRGRDGHHAPPKMRLRIRDRAVRHRLLVVRAVGRQVFAVPVKRLANPRDVAMPEDREHAAKKRLARCRALCREVAHERLRGGEADRSGGGLRRCRMRFALVHAACSCVTRAAVSPRAVRHAPISVSNVRRTRAISSLSSISPASHARLGS